MKKFDIVLGKNYRLIDTFENLDINIKIEKIERDTMEDIDESYAGAYKIWYIDLEDNLKCWSIIYNTMGYWNYEINEENKVGKISLIELD